MDRLFKWSRFIENIPILLPYLTVTFQIVAYATLFGLLLALVVVWVKIKKIPIVYQIINVYVSFMRGTPMLVQLMLIYYGLPLLINSIFKVNVGRSWSALIFTYITFLLNQGAFLSSIIYSSLASVPIGQTEASYSVGLTTFQSFQRIVVPQAIRIALPAFGSDLVGVFHNASLVFSIGVIDIMGRAKTISAATGHALEAYLIVSIVFVIISLLLRGSFAYLNKKLDYN